MQQVAGDVLPPARGKLNRDGIIATGVYVLGEWGGGDSDKDKLITDIVDDQVDLTGRAFMGMTIACARCHDHKFDPISTEDYYGLAGIFFSTHILPDPGPKTAGPNNIRIPLLEKDDMAQRKVDEAQLAQLDKELESTLDEQYTTLARAMIPRAGEYLAAAWEYAHSPADAGAPQPPLAQFAIARGLRPYELSQWLKFVAAPQLDLLSEPAKDITGPAGVHGWRNASNADAPVVLVNTTPQAVETIPTLVVPGRSVNLHPSPTAGVGVTWKSLVSGRVRITGRVTDGHSVCGDGIAWSISTAGGKTPGELASGTIANGGAQALTEGTGGARLDSVDVIAGEKIQLAVLPKVEYSCDTTRIELKIIEVGGAGRTWDLEKDATISGNVANPLPDAYGNAATWAFHDLAKQSGAAFAAGSPISRFTGAMASAANLRSAAADVAKSLLAMDHEVRRMRDGGEDPAMLSSPDAAFYQMLTSPRGPFWIAARSDDAHLPADVRADLASKRAEATKLRGALAEPIPVAQAMQEGGTPKSMFAGIQDVPVHIRGRYDRLGRVVPRRFPQIIAGLEQRPITQGSGRLELAKWLASSDHPLTARVMVNRIWQHHFGEGIVRTPNNFGKLGTLPTHPELLDHLAIEFVRSGWSVKAMHRMMMLSATYMQSSVPPAELLKADPANELLGRMNRRKLEAEALRDAMLAVAGALDITPGGKAINDLNTTRRSLYLMTIRSDRSNYRALFDAADPAAIVEKRNDSIVAPQALFLMNHPFMLERARQLAARVAKEATGDDAAKIDWLYRMLFARHAEPREVDIGKLLVASSDAGWQAYCQVLLCANEFMYVD
jgi:hypothetical protein